MKANDPVLADRVATLMERARRALGGETPVWLRTHLFEGAMVLGLGILLSWELFVPPVIGLANNGDFYRIAPQSGVYYIHPGGPETLDPNVPDYVSLHYRTDTPKNPQGYYSSGVMLMWLARGVNDLVRRDALFDIRFLGAVHLGFLLAVLVGLLATLAKYSAPSRWVMAILACFMLSDVGYFSFFNSFYSESATLVFLLLWTAAVFQLPKREEPLSFRDGFFWVCSLLFLTAKPQNAVVAPLSIALWWCLRWPRSEGRRGRWILIVGGCGLFAITAIYLAMRPFQQVNRYNHVFQGILGKDPEAVESLSAFGLGDEYVELIGTHWWSPLSAAQDDLKWSTAGKLKTSDIVRYYWHHPERFAALFSQGAAAAFKFRPEGLGNFERSRGGPPREMSSRLAHWTGVKQALYPRTSPTLIAAGILLAVLWGALLRFSGGASETSRPALLGLCLWGMAGLQLFAVLIGGGEVELVRHLFLFNALLDVSLIVLALAMVSRIQHWRQVSSR